MGHGAGLTDGEADDIASTVAADDVIGYIDAVGDAVREWLATTSAAEFEDVPAFRARNRGHERYGTPSAWEEIKALEGLPAWQFLTRPCVGHIRGHAGEIDTLLQLLRTQSAPAG